MTIYIKQLRFEAIIGILPHERNRPQPIEIDLEASYIYKEGYFLDYALVAEQIVTTMQQGEFFLIEEALEHLFSSLKQKFSTIKTLKIAICKPKILPNCRVCVEEFREFL